MKKNLIITVLCVASLVCVLSIWVYAACISPAADFIARDIQFIKSGVTNNDIYFSADDFARATGAEEINEITVIELPSEDSGRLMLGDMAVYKNQTVSSSDLELLRFEPKTDVLSCTSFTVNCKSNCGEYPVNCEIKLLKEPNAAPTSASEPQSFTTRTNVTYYGKLEGNDPEGDKLCFEITCDARHGVVSITDKESGTYKYKPQNNYTGKDSFSYTVCDENGNYCNECEVSVSVEKNTSGVYYCDMQESRAHNAAITLAEKGILTGEKVGENMLFGPDYRVSRADFVAMTMDACGIETDDTLKTTSFTDNDDIPEHLRSHIATAERLGYISGTQTEDGVFFYPNNTITRAEAAVILNRILELQTSAEIEVFADDGSIPSWASSSIYAMRYNGIMRGVGEGNFSSFSPLTREQAAIILCAAINIIS